MIDVDFIKAHSQRLKDAIPGINYNQVIVDDSQLVRFLEERSKSDEHLLFAVIPDFTNAGASADNVKKQTETFLLVLQKTDYSDIDHDEFLQIMQNTLIIARAIETKMITDKYDYTAEGCMYMKQLNVGSIRITSVWGLASCNGWSIEFNFEEVP